MASSHPVPSFPLRGKILALRGSSLVSLCLVFPKVGKSVTNYFDVFISYLNSPLNSRHIEYKHVRPNHKTHPSTKHEKSFAP